MSRGRHPRVAALRALTPIVRRLHLQELPRIRREHARLVAENDRLQQQLWDADDRAEWFHDALMRAEDIQLGLTRDGQLLVAPAEVRHG